jgi:hypothetical protein
MFGKKSLNKPSDFVLRHAFTETKPFFSERFEMSLEKPSLE